MASVVWTWIVKLCMFTQILTGCAPQTVHRNIRRMVCVNVTLDGQLVKRFEDQSGWANDRYDIAVRREGKVIRITRYCSFYWSDGPTINICEVQVWVCDDGWYGDCTHTCGHCAGTSICDKIDGNCTSRDTGFQPPLCQGSTVGLWEDNCSRACGDGCENRTCDTVDGTCTCMNGWAKPRCEDCQNESASTAGPIVGAVCGSIASCVVGFLLGILFMRCRLYQAKTIKRSVPAFSPSNQREFSSSPPEESRPPRPDTEDYERPSQPANVYDSLKAARDDNVYTNWMLQRKRVLDNTSSQLGCTRSKT